MKIRNCLKCAAAGAVLLTAMQAAPTAFGAGAAVTETERGRETRNVPINIADDCFVLREYGGKIALFSGDSAEPLAVYRLPVSGLNPADEALLRGGIRLKTRQELKRLIEDMELY